ncbi:MAG TPA: DUF2066 domain-containing protein [Alphaproteobacteria bacterium]|nr:DUF2066 domain-containing protein [Alphaproteobacteria bacterium]
MGRAGSGLRRLVVALVLAAFAAVAPAAAQSPPGEAELYTVRDVEVDVTAANATAARERAIAEGQQKAFARLAERLVSETDRARLPQLDATAVADLVRDFEVQQEKVSAVRYLGTLTYRFRPNAVKSLFRGSGVAAIEQPAPATLVLPVLREGGRARLWSDPEPNPWLEAWNAQGGFAGLVPVVLPLGDLTDVAALDGPKAAAGDVEGITALMAHHNAGAAVVAVAEGPVEPKRPLTIAVNRFYPGLAAESVVVTAPPADTTEAALNGAVAAVMAELDRIARSEAGGEGGTESVLSVAVPFAALPEWLDIRKRLGQIGAVSEVQLKSLTRDRARLELKHRGSEVRLRSALLQGGLILAPAETAGDPAVLRLSRTVEPTGAEPPAPIPADPAAAPAQ